MMMMQLLGLLLLGGGCCLAQTPQPCTCPPLMSGQMTVSTQNEALWASAKFFYDSVGQRYRLQQTGIMKNKTFTMDVLLLFKEHTVYTIDEAKRTCIKSFLKDSFHPMEIPKDSTLLGQVVVGSSSTPGEGLLVNTWTGEFTGGVKFMATVTEFGCIPVNAVYHTPNYGWLVHSYFNNVKGIQDPGKLIPPPYCPTAEVEIGQKPVDFFSLFL
ncbi:unnamed protein product [Merluccius merluccius]